MVTLTRFVTLLHEQILQNGHSCQTKGLQLSWYELFHWEAASDFESLVDTKLGKPVFLTHKHNECSVLTQHKH